MDLYLTVHMAWLHASMPYANCKVVAHSMLKLHQL